MSRAVGWWEDQAFHSRSRSCVEGMKVILVISYLYHSNVSIFNPAAMYMHSIQNMLWLIL